MSQGQTNRLYASLNRLALAAQHGESDGQLLSRFHAHSDAEAFAELVRRHGGMVLGVCRRILGERHAADDAYQPTFLVLIRQAHWVQGERVAAWLYGVARRTALSARTRLARRRRAEVEAGSRRPHPVSAPEMPSDLRSLLDEELGRLPEKYSAPVVLCLLEGKSRKEAAELLGWKEGTLSGRLARAKEMLSVRLERRGVALSVALAASATSAVPAFAGVGAQSVTVIALAEEVMRTMWLTKCKVVLGVLVLVTVLGWGASVTSRGSEQTDKPAASGKEKSPAPVQVREDPFAYIIEPPDILRVQYEGANEPFNVTCLVRPDGTISLGAGDSIYVSGLTLRKARTVIARQLARQLVGFDARKLIVEVANYNSKFFYVICNGKDGEQVFRLPATGNELVLDVLNTVQGLKGNTLDMVLHRSDKDGKKILPVDLEGITQRGVCTTNYALFSGDRLYVNVRDAGKLMEPPPVRPDPLVVELESALEALRVARTPQERRKVAESLDRVRRKLREKAK